VEFDSEVPSPSAEFRWLRLSPGPTSMHDGRQGRQTGGSTGCNENTQLAPSDESLIESADGRVATV